MRVVALASDEFTQIATSSLLPPKIRAKDFLKNKKNSECMIFLLCSHNKSSTISWLFLSRAFEPHFILLDFYLCLPTNNFHARLSPSWDLYLATEIWEWLARHDTFWQDNDWLETSLFWSLKKSFLDGMQESGCLIRHSHVESCLFYSRIPFLSIWLFEICHAW